MEQLYVFNQKGIQQLLDKIDLVYSSVKGLEENQLVNRWLDNDEAQKLLKVSKRTLQNWRDSGVIAFSQIGHKIYYRRSDVDEMLLRHYNQTFKPP